MMFEVKGFIDRRREYKKNTRHPSANGVQRRCPESCLDATYPAEALHGAALAEAKLLAELPGEAYAKNKRGLRADAAAAIELSLKK